MNRLLLDASVVQSPELFGKHVSAATGSLQRGDRAGAEKIYHSVLAAHPRHASTWVNLAALAIGLGEANAGRAHAQRVLSVDARNVDAWINFGVASWQVNQRRDSERAFLQALVLSPGLETPALNLSQMWQGIARYDLAMDMLEVALAHNPGSSRLHQARAETARLGGLPEAARHHALAAITALLPELAPSVGVATTAVDAASLEAGREAMRSTMTATCDRLTSAGIDYVFFGGVVLGIARDGEPFHGDKDIDLALSPDVDTGQLETLFADGFTMMRAPKGPHARRWCMGWTDDTTGIGVDLFLDDIESNGTRHRCLGWPDSLYYDYPAFAITTLHWRGRDWPVPSPLPEYLASDYGKDWHEPRRVVGDRSFDKCWLDTQISSPALVAESRPRAINLVLLRIITALRRKQWQKALALCDQVLARETIPQVEVLRDQLLLSGIR